MAKFTSPLDHVRVAAPCPADWERMVGTDRVRFCGQCNLNVYNLSAMSKSEAEAFIMGNEGRLCVRFFRRPDGSILTENCPVGLRAIRKRLSRVAQALTTAVLSFLTGLGLYSLTRSQLIPREPLMGDIAVVPQKPAMPAMTGVMAIKRPTEVKGEMVILQPPNQPERSRRK